MVEKVLNIPCGYQLKRVEDNTEKVKSTCICPYCNNEETYLTVRNKQWEEFEEKNIMRIRQMTIFDLDSDEQYSLESLIDLDRKWQCSICGKYSKYSRESKKIIINSDKNKISIESAISIKEAINLNWAHTFNIEKFPIREKITFNLRKGRVYLELLDSDEKIHVAYDITKNGDLCAEDPIGELLIFNKNIRGVLAEYWRCMYKSCPFDECELNLTNLILMTKYVGYDKLFYYSIPFEDDKLSVDKDFSKISNKLHYSENVPEIFRSSSLPQIKSVKRVCFQNPHILFYIAELEKLWKIINNNDIFTQLIENKSVYYCLDLLHEFPGLFELCETVCRLKDEKILVNCLLEYPNCFLKYAMEYSVMSKRNKIKEHKLIIKDLKGRIKWLHLELVNGLSSICMDYEFQINPSYDESVKKFNYCRIGEYEFILLHSSREFIKVSKALGNCLRDWGDFYFCHSVVIGVKKNDKYVAAIQSDFNNIYQAKTFYNDNIESNSSLGKAYKKWCDRMGIKLDMLSAKI